MEIVVTALRFVAAVGKAAALKVGVQLATTTVAGMQAALAIGSAVIAGTAVLANKAMSMFEIDMPQVDSDASRQRTVKSTTEPYKIIYGETLVSGPISFIGMKGTNNEDLYHVVALAGHEVTDITDIYFDNELISDSAINSGSSAGGNVTSGIFGPRNSTTICIINKHLGTATQAADSMMVNAFTDYTSAHQGKGIAYIAMKWKLNEDSAEVWEKYAPSDIKAIVKGKPVYDPRLDTGGVGNNPADDNFITYSATVGSYVGQGQNPALILADYLINDDFGMGIASSKIDWNAIVTAANGCDVSVDVPNNATEKRFTCNGVLFGTDSHRRNITKILSSMNGSLVYSNGKYVLHAGIFEAATEDLNEDDLIGAIGIKTSFERSDRFNTIKGLFVDPAQNHKSSEFPKVQLADAVNRDNQEILEKEVQYPMTNSSYMAQRLSYKLIKLSDQQKVVSFPANLSALRIKAGDRVRVSVEELSWSNKVFQCVGWTFSDEGGVNLTLREDAQSAYDDPSVTPTNEYSTITASGDITDAFRGVPSPSSLSATAGLKNIELNWVNPLRPADYGTIYVYASPNSNFSSAVKIGETDGTQFIHDGSNPVDSVSVDDVRHYWVRAIKNVGTDSSARSDLSNSDSATVGAVEWTDVANPTIGIDLNNDDSISINLGASNSTSGQAVAQSGISEDVTITQGGIRMNAGGSIRGGQTSYNSGEGFFLGYDSNKYKLSIRNSTSEALTFDGDDLTITGTVNASAGAFTGSVSVSNTGAIYGGTMNEFLKANTSGFFLGYDTNAYKLSVGDASGEVLTWDGSKLNVEANTVSFSTGGEQDYSSQSRYTTSQKSASVVLANNSSYFLFDNRRQDLAFPDFIVSYYLGPLTSGTQSSQANARNGIMDSIQVELFYADASTGTPATWTSFRSVTAGSWYTDTGLGAMFSNFRVKDSGTYVASLDTRNGILDDYPTIAPFGDEIDGTSVPVGLVDNDYFINIPLSKNTFVFPKGRYFIKVVITVTDGSLSPYPATGSPTATERRVSIPNASSFVHPDFGQAVFVGGAHTTIFTDNNRDNETLIKGGSVYLMSKEGANADDSDSTAIFFGGRGTTGGTPNSAYGPLHGLYFFNDRDSIGSGSGILGSIGNPNFAMYVPYDGSKLTFEGDANFLNGLYINGVAVNAGAVTGPAGSDTQIQYNNGGSLGASANLTFNDSTNTLTVQNLTVSGTTTTVNTSELTVKDPNITLNYSTGDSSSTANNAGITIQDAVDSTTDASILWKTASDSFEFSHNANIPKTYVNATSENAVSGTWNNASSNPSWGSIKFGAGYSWTDGVGAYKQFNIPTGADTCYMSQLKWNTGGYVDVHGVQADGDLVFLGRIGTGQSVENSNHGNTIEHDGQAIDKIGSGLDAFSAIRITNRRGRFHLTGLAFSTQHLDNFNGGMIAAEMLHSGVLSNVTNTNWDAAYTYSQVGHLPLAGGTLTGAVSWPSGSSTNANTAYTYSQVGHLPLAGGTLTGNLTLSPSSTTAQITVGGSSQTSLSNLLLYAADGTGTQSAQMFKVSDTYTSWGGVDSFNIYTSKGTINFHPAGGQDRFVVESGRVYTKNAYLLVGNNGTTNSYATVATGNLYFGGLNTSTPEAYSIGAGVKENVGGDYTKLDIQWHTGIRIGAYPSYGGTRFYNNSMASSGVKIFSVGEGDDKVRVYNDLNVSGNANLSGNLDINKAGADTIVDIKGNINNDPILNLRSDQNTITTEGFQIWYDNSVGDVHLHTTYASDDAAIRFHTRTGTDKATNNERFTINGNGLINITTGNLAMNGSTVISNDRSIDATSIEVTGSYSGGSGDMTNVTNAQLKIGSAGTSDFWRIPHFSQSSTVSGVYNYQTGKNVYWGETTDTGTYYFRGRNLEVSNGNVSVNGTISSGAITAYKPLILNNTVAANNTGDFKIIQSLNASGGVGFAASILGVNIDTAVNTNNLPTQDNTWGGVTGSAALVMSADISDGLNSFRFMTTPQSSSAGTVLSTIATMDYEGGFTANGYIRSDSSYKIGTTTVINASRNLINIGTISSGAITATNITATGTSTGPFNLYGTESILYLNVGSTTQTSYTGQQYTTDTGNAQFFRGGTNFSSWGGANSFNIYNNNGPIAFHPSGTANVLKLESSLITAIKNISLNNDSTYASLTLAGAQTNGLSYSLHNAIPGVSNTGFALRRSGSINTLYFDGSDTAAFAGNVILGGTATSTPYANAGTKLTFGGGSDFANYSISTALENVGGNYTKLDFRWHTGIRMGAQGLYGGIRFYNNEDFTSKLMSIGEGSGVTDVKVYNDLITVGNIAAGDAFRSDRSEDASGAFLFRKGAASGATRHLNLADTTTDPANVLESDNPTGISWGQRTDSNGYYIIKLKGAYNNGYSTYSRLSIGWHTGLEIGANTAYGGIRFFGESPTIAVTNELMSIGKGDNHVRVGNNLYVTGSMNAGAITGSSATLTGALTLTSTATSFTGIQIGSNAQTDFSLLALNSNSGNFQAWKSGTGYTSWGGASAMNYYTSAGDLCFHPAGNANVLRINSSGLSTTGNVTAYFSDMRLKTKIGNIENALDKVRSLSGFRYVENDLAKELGYSNDKQQVGLSAQQIQAVIPEAVSLAPFDIANDEHTGEVISKSGENYLTVDYSKLVPLLVEAIKELTQEVETLKTELKEK